MNRRNFIHLLGCGCLSLGFSSCTTTPITNRKQLRIIPEHKLNEIRKGDGKKAVELFFNSVFSSIDEDARDETNYAYQIPDEPTKYNNAMLNSYLLSILSKHLDDKEYDVLRMSYGLDCVKHSAT